MAIVMLLGVSTGHMTAAHADYQQTGNQAADIAEYAKTWVGRSYSGLCASFVCGCARAVGMTTDQMNLNATVASPWVGTNQFNYIDLNGNLLRGCQAWTWKDYLSGAYQPRVGDLVFWGRFTDYQEANGHQGTSALSIGDIAALPGEPYKHIHVGIMRDPPDDNGQSVIIYTVDGGGTNKSVNLRDRRIDRDSGYVGLWTIDDETHKAWLMEFVRPNYGHADDSHEYTMATVTKAPTATTPGVRTLSCRCGKAAPITETIPALNLVNLPDGVYAIQGKQSGSWLTAPEGIGETVYISSGDTPGERQLWQFTKNGDDSYTITSTATGLALDVEGASSNIGARVITFSPNGTIAQNWYVVQDDTGWLQIVAQCSFYNLDVKNAHTYDGAPLQQCSQTYHDAQYWKLADEDGGHEEPPSPVTGRTIADGDYVIVNKNHNNFYLNVSDERLPTMYGPNVVLDGPPSFDTSAAWRVTYNDKGGYYTIRHISSDLMLDVDDRGTETGVNIQTYEENGTTAQQWMIEKGSDGEYFNGYYLRPKCSDLYLTADGEFAAGTNIVQQSFESATEQQWLFMPTGFYGYATVRYMWEGFGEVLPAQVKAWFLPADLSLEIPESRVSASAESITLVPGEGTVKTEALDGWTMFVHDFTGWNTEKDGSGTAYKPGDIYSGFQDLTLYAQYTTSAPSYLYLDGLPTASRENYYFLGWSEQADGSPPIRVPGDTLFQAKKLYAVWGQPDLILPVQLTTLGEEAFTDCPFRFAALSENTVLIEKNAFAGCSNLAYICIPNAETIIDPDAFGELGGLTILGKAGSTAQAAAADHKYSFITIK